MSTLTVYFTDFVKSWSESVGTYTKIVTDSKLGTIVITDLSAKEIPSDATRKHDIIRLRSLRVVFDSTSASSIISGGTKSYEVTENTYYLESSFRKVWIRY